MIKPGSALELAAGYGRLFRQQVRPLHPTATTEALRAAFCQPLQSAPMDPTHVLSELIKAAEPGLVGNTDPNFYAWVMGGSDPVGVAADWLTSIWGQNAAIFQTSPAAAVAEEAVSAWLLDLLDLPRESSVGLVTGATMAGFVGLAAARSVVLERAGHDFEEYGLQGAPKITVFVSDDAHVTNLSALRYLGFGRANVRAVASDAAGLMRMDALERDLALVDGPKIIIGQAGHIHSGGFEDFVTMGALAGAHDAWLHIDGAFGLWARVLDEKAELTRGLELADSWSVDGHKWLQLPYDSGFAIVRHPAAHRRAMDISASFLNRDPSDGRNPTEYNPELSRRARGFAAWALFRTLGVEGIRTLVRGHCGAAAAVVAGIRDLPGLELVGTADLNQIVLSPGAATDAEAVVAAFARELNARHGLFVKTARWKGREVLRLSIIIGGTDDRHTERLISAIRSAWTAVLETA